MLALLVLACAANQATADPVRVGVVGLTHGHVNWILGREDRGDIELVGIAEPNLELAQRLAARHGFSMDIVFTSTEAMLDRIKPEAVTAFNSIYEHLETVELCAPRGVHVMVEKPLAVNTEHAKRMAALAKKHDIHLLTNYETTWYPSNHRLYEMVREDQSIGGVRKMVMHAGHQGPKEIGVSDEFLAWLTDPVLNGGGAVIDFGCYGANLLTWLMQGQRPLSVSAELHTNKPAVYPQVDDEATIVLQYPDAQGIIQASWNWPFSRKDWHVYGETGYIYQDDRNHLRYRFAGAAEEALMLPDRPALIDDPFAYLAAVVRGSITPQPYDLSSLKNNLIVVEILDAAIKSHESGCRVQLTTD